MTDSEPDEDAIALFAEPDDFFEPERQPTQASHTLRSGQTLQLRLVGYNPLWGHHLWNAGRTVADYLEDHASELIGGRSVLELGAGAGLPSLVAAIRGAKAVVVTDYPDVDLIENLAYNIEHCSTLPQPKSVMAKGYLWGAPIDDLTSEVGSFDVLILADLLFNHSEHAKLISSIRLTLKHAKNAQALVFFTPYRPWLLEKDLAFFDLAKAAGFNVEKILEHVMDKVMFDTDPGVSVSSHAERYSFADIDQDELLRRTVFGYRLKWADSNAEA